MAHTYYNLKLLIRIQISIGVKVKYFAPAVKQLLMPVLHAGQQNSLNRDAATVRHEMLKFLLKQIT